MGLSSHLRPCVFPLLCMVHQSSKLCALLHTRSYGVVFPILSHGLIAPNRTQVEAQGLSDSRIPKSVAHLQHLRPSSWINWGSVSCPTHSTGSFPGNGGPLTQLSDRLRHVRTQLKFSLSSGFTLVIISKCSDVLTKRF